MRRLELSIKSVVPETPTWINIPIQKGELLILIFHLLKVWTAETRVTCKYVFIVGQVVWFKNARGITSSDCCALLCPKLT